MPQNPDRQDSEDEEDTMLHRARRYLSPALLCLVLGATGGFLARELGVGSRGEAQGDLPKRSGAKLVSEGAAVFDPNWDKEYPQYQPVGKMLQPCPDLRPGDLPPQDLSVFGGRGKTSF